MNPISFALIAVFLFAASLAHAECKHLPLAIEHTKLSLAEAKAGKSGGMSFPLFFDQQGRLFRLPVFPDPDSSPIG